MSTLSPPTPIAPAPATAPRHSLIASAQPVTENDNRWMGGMEWVPEVCGIGWGVWNPCPVDQGTGEPLTGGDRPLKSSPEDGPENGIYQPFYVEMISQCSGSLHQADLEARARRQLEGITPIAVEGEFWDGTLRPTNYSLRGGTPAQTAWPTPLPGHHRVQNGILNPSYTNGSTLTAVSPSVALRLLTAGLARGPVAARGTIHAPAPLVEAWDQSGSLKEDGARLITKSRGDTVIAYSGGSWAGPSELGSAGDADLDNYWAYATGPAQIRLGEPETLEQLPGAFKHRINTIEYRVERVAAVTVDPCFSLAVLTTPYT